MSSLNILCAICSEYFKNTDVIYCTRCGHVFHKFCLFQWLKSAQTCPQCRKYCMKHHCIRLYVNFMEPVLDDAIGNIEFPKHYEWVYIGGNMDLGDDLSFALKFGLDEEGNDIYAARGRYNGDIIPGHYVASKKSVVVPWGFESHEIKDNIELLDISNDDAEYKWIAASDGKVPDNALVTGDTAIGDILYTGRALFEGKMLYGKIHQRYGQAYMPYKNKEVSTYNYEVLVRIAKKKGTITETVTNIQESGSTE